eukprot:GFUD01010656.1.p1 GENE.GFUD01010656.1~~GFUD01010656.1.p1  ORF type:complete len:448 (-),score=125.08 GFUD01010656.1:111-1454(-)
MDPIWEFQAPQFVDFNNLGETEDKTVDEFFNVDMESGEHWVTAVSSLGEEKMDEDVPDSPLSLSTRSDRTFQVASAISVPLPTLCTNLPPKKPSNMVTSWGPGQIIKTSGTGINTARAPVKGNPIGRGGKMRKMDNPSSQNGAVMARTIGAGKNRNTPRHHQRTPRRLAVGNSRLGAGTPKRLGTNYLEPRLAVARPRTQAQRSLNTPTASRMKRKSPSIPIPFPHTLEVVKRFKNKVLGAELQPSKQPPTKFRSQAEQILSFQRSTPSRFRTRQQSARPRYGSVQQEQPQPALAQLQRARPRLATVPQTPNLATKARCLNRKKATVVETLAESVKIKAGQHRLAVSAAVPSITVPEPFKLSTQFRAGEREPFELMKRQKEKAAEEQRRLEDVMKENEEQEEIVKVRKTLVHRAQPVANYKPLVIKRSDKKLTMPASPHLRSTRGAN